MGVSPYHGRQGPGQADWGASRMWPARGRCLFGSNSGAALATVVGVLIEVPIKFTELS
jgi:hypothetical protein